MTITVNGKLSYNIYLRSSAVYGIASNKDNQEKYGIYPYESDKYTYNGAAEKAHISTRTTSAPLKTPIRWTNP